MTIREAIETVRYMVRFGMVTERQSEALNLCALMAERHVNHNRNNKKRQRLKRKEMAVSEGCKEVARHMAEKNPGGGGLWRLRK